MNSRSLFLTSLFFFSALLGVCQPGEDTKQTDIKMSQTIDLIRRFYVEKADLSKIVEKGIIEMLTELDPHSVYISSKEVEKSNEPLIGNFDGIGVSYQIIKDTINVIEVISGGPSEKVGVLPGDKILIINGKPATGDSITNSFVMDNLRGKKGTVAEVTILRHGANPILTFSIKRDKIPLHSIDTYFMVDKEIGYLRLDRFSQTSMDEFSAALAELKKSGMKKMILDLRGNGGGFLHIAVELANQFLEQDKLIVFTEGVASKRQDFISTRGGGFTEGRLVILIDEGSASASEIVSGAIQDWDRGIIIGRRSFGKGLVQKPFNLADGSQIRLTISRYYTPSGRCIQKPYSDGLDSYFKDYMKRVNKGELITADSIQFPDSLKFYTQSKRVVYGGGGIMPDIFVPIDTLKASDYLIELRSKGTLTNFTVEWANNHRELLKTYPTFELFDSIYTTLGIEKEFDEFAQKAGIQKNTIRKEWIQNWYTELLKQKVGDTIEANKKYSSYNEYLNKLLSSTAQLEKELHEKAEKEDQLNTERMRKSEDYLSHQIKALIVRNLYGIKYYYAVMRTIDEGFIKAMDVIQNDDLFIQFNIEKASGKRTKKK